MSTDEPRPSQVPGYADAVASGLVRGVPAEQPMLLPGPSARGLAQRYGVLFAVLTLAYVVLFAFVESPLVLIGTGMVWLLLGCFLFGRVGDRLVEELRLGYATLLIDSGMFWIRMSGWISWSFDGVWRFTGRGVRPPAPGVTDPPGLYPSPHRQGRWEIWTGHVWTGVHRPAPRG